AAVVAGNVETSQCITDALYGALGVLAASQGTMNNFTLGNERYQYYETVAGGSGAGPGFDGADVVQTHMTNSRLTDPEVLEWRFPVLLESFAIRDASGGQGRWRGGHGAVLAAIDGRATLADVAQKSGNEYDAEFQRLIIQLDKDGFIREVSSGAAAGPAAAAAKPAGKLDTAIDLDFSSLASSQKANTAPQPTRPPPPPAPRAPAVDMAAKAAAERRAKEQESALHRARKEAEEKAGAERERQRAEAEAKVRAETEAKP